MFVRVQRLGRALLLGVALTVCGGAGVAIAASSSHISARIGHTVAHHRRPHRAVHHDAHTSRDYMTALNVAIAGTASASTQASGSPAS